MPDSDPQPITPDTFAARLAERTGAMSTRMLAHKSGWSRSTVSELRVGRRLPTAQQLADLLGAAGASTDEIAIFEQLLLDCTPLAATSPADVPTAHRPTDQAAADVDLTATTRTTRQRTRQWVAIGSIAVLLAGGGGFVSGRITAGPSGPVVATAAVIANTENLGVMTYSGPSRRNRAPGTLPEGTRIAIVCQAGDGEPLTDRVDGTVMTWPVWDKLDDGRWIPDIYTNLSKHYEPTARATALLTC